MERGTPQKSARKFACPSFIVSKHSSRHGVRRRVNTSHRHVWRWVNASRQTSGFKLAELRARNDSGSYLAIVVRSLYAPNSWEPLLVDEARIDRESPGDELSNAGNGND